jgi:uncharacterized phage infection (PIP) family protein YhgE
MEGEMPMTEEKTSRHIGRKIWYGVVISLSVLVILVSVAGIIGEWIVESTLSDISVSLLTVVENSAGSLRQVGARVDTKLVEAQQITGNISQAAGQLSQNVADKGLAMVLLPEEQEQKLTTTVQTISDSFANVKDLLASGLEMYRMIDRMPFVNLPAPDPETVSGIQASIDGLNSSVTELTGAIQEFRSGAASQVDKISSGADRVTGLLQDTSNRLAELDTRLADMQAKATQLKQVIPTVLVVVAVLMTLFLAYVIYTQVEVIRLFVRRWKELG